MIPWVSGGRSVTDLQTDKLKKEQDKIDAKYGLGPFATNEEILEAGTKLANESAHNHYVE